MRDESFVGLKVPLLEKVPLNKWFTTDNGIYIANDEEKIKQVYAFEKISYDNK